MDGHIIYCYPNVVNQVSRWISNIINQKPEVEAFTLSV